MPVYFLALGDEYIKIGFSENLPKRIRDLTSNYAHWARQKYLPIRLLGTVPGDLRREREILVGAPGVIYSDWGRILEILPRTPELEAYIAGLRSTCEHDRREATRAYGCLGRVSCADRSEAA